MNTETIPNNVSKPTHYDPSVLQGSMRERQPPKALVLVFIKLHTASLRENLSDLLNYHGTKHVTYHHCIWEKKKQLNRFNKDQYLIPKSDRINFKFHVSQESEHSEEFSSLKEETDRIITNLRKSLKEQVTNK